MKPIPLEVVVGEDGQRRLDGSKPPVVGHRYHVRAEQHPHELVTFTAWCVEATVCADGIVDSRWDNGVILVARGVLYYPNDPWPA